eukprot:CAMPEP_0174943680 /NCGR_PEP_ID=MMETSP1355-20121228/77220_1 /TAXON_ID=464990 /ORGANISM="Hemiselmis tepida, Strain CCMP443" /LENGTH=37 /DNA_ID= /DNA_START= /DNA_END= /DNA_ORIENTATION=
MVRRVSHVPRQGGDLALGHERRKAFGQDPRRAQVGSL